jgi:four helix bundle protein
MKDEVQNLRDRTRQFALRVIRLYVALPKTNPGQVIAKQILRSGTSVGAHYREACRGKSNADFIDKIEGALQELEETAYRLELLADSAIVKSEKLNPLLDEANQLTAIMVTMTKRVRQKAMA